MKVNVRGSLFKTNVPENNLGHQSKSHLRLLAGSSPDDARRNRKIKRFSLISADFRRPRPELHRPASGERQIRVVPDLIEAGAKQTIAAASQ